MKKIILGLAILSLLLAAAPAWAQGDGLAALAKQAAQLAQERLGPLNDAKAVACFTNAGYASCQGQNTQILYDLLPRWAAVSLGQGNLLVRPCPPDSPLYFMFVKKQAGDKLMMTYVRAAQGKLTASPALNIYVGQGTSFAPFKKVLGPMTFNLVSLANGWAMGLPPDMMRAAMRHGHLCCGVFTGYFTARYILKHLPLKPGERYIYIGAPAWCQDDYLLDYLAISPGTHGYVTMSFPWSRSWQTKQRLYRNLGGIVVRWNPRTQSGQALVLAFDWHHDAFRRFLGQPDLKLDWRGQPWLHKAYDRFFMSKLGQPDYFVSTLKSAPLKDKAQLESLTRLGANPLQVLLGPDPAWPPRAKAAP